MSYKLVADHFGTVCGVKNLASGIEFVIPADGNTDYERYLAWLDAGNTPEPADVPSENKVERVRAETLRRLLLAFGARDQEHLSIKVQDATIQAGGLTDKLAQGVALSPQEEGLAEYLRNAQALYLAIKAAGNAFEAQAQAGTLPADFADNANWPAMG